MSRNRGHWTDCTPRGEAKLITADLWRSYDVRHGDGTPRASHFKVAAYLCALGLVVWAALS